MDSPSQQLMRVNKYVWLCLTFVLAYFLLVGERSPFDTPRSVVWGVFALAVASVTARTFLALRRLGSAVNSNRLFNHIDISLIGLGIAVTSGIDSDLWLLYFALMTFAALYAAPSGQRTIDFGVSVLYILATLPHQLQPHTALPAPIYLRILGTRLFFLLVVSALTRRLRADAEARSQEVLRLREQMASADERARVAREVHDSLGHMMVSTLLRLDLCARLMEVNPPEAKEILHEEIPALRAAWNEARDMAFHLRPWEADIAPEGLIEALRQRCRLFAGRMGLIVEVVAKDENCKLRPESAFEMIRIVQEALTNAAKHAQASHIDVTLSRVL